MGVVVGTTPWLFDLRGRALVPIVQEGGCAQGRYDSMWRRENPLPRPRFELRTIQPVASCCTAYWTIVYHHWATWIRIFAYLLTPWSRALLEKLTGFAANQEIPRILWNPKVHYRTHKTAWCFCQGHSLKQGRRSHFLSIRLGSALCIRAIRVLVHSQISGLIPHSVSRCSMVSCLPHCVQFSVSVRPILCNLTFVGVMPCITMYHAELGPSGNITLWRLPHASDQSVAGWRCMMHTSRCLDSAGVIHPSFEGPPCFGLPLGFHIRPFVKINA